MRRADFVLLAVLCCMAACLSAVAEEVVDTGDFLVVASSKQGPVIGFLYEEGASACENDGECAAYSVQFTGLFELHNGNQVEQSGIGFSHIPWILSGISQVQDDPICSCATQVVTISNNGAGSQGAWTSLAISIHIPADVGTSHFLADIDIEGFQWRDVQAQQLVVELHFTANNADGLVPATSMLTDNESTAELVDGYLQVAPLAEAVSQSTTSHLQVPSLLNATTTSVQLVYGGFPAGYDFTSQLTMGIDSASDPAILPSMQPISSNSDSSVPGSSVFLDVVIGIGLLCLLVLVFLSILSAFLWYNSSSRTFINRLLDRSSKDEARPLSA